ncbi:MAG TPA: SpoIIE family protein phosphatase [Solirubrobacteraceae bacterium]|jgi:serine phosphatase RsbU (regulator of sigma subunit)/PAS domain-containing protein|nr:SpoIIE family protein phosphatase [Solirubrobacteraceae bacterium]
MPETQDGQPTSVNARPQGELAMSLLIEAGAVLASSLDLTTTMGQVARLTVPRHGDLCVIDLRDEDGSIKGVAVASAVEGLAQELERLRTDHPLDPQGRHPVAQVIRSGEPVLLAEMTDALLDSFAQGSRHAKFMIDHGYRSAVVAPLRARGRTLGALSVLRLGATIPFDEEDLDLMCELARRAGLAIDNARLFSEMRAVERRLEAVLVNLAEAITVVDEQGRTVFANQAAADLLQVDDPDELMRAQPGAIMSRFLVLDEQGRELDLDRMPGRRLFAGEDPGALLVRNIVRATGEERWIIVRASPIADPDSGRNTYVVNVFENITEVKRVQLAESFMAEASRVLASSMDYSETLQRVARLAVPQIADWCAVDLLSHQDEIERVAIHHPDPAMVALAERLNRDYHSEPQDSGGVPEVIRTGEARIYTDIQPDALAGYARDRQHLELLRAIGATAVVIVPMIGATGAIGAITLVSSQSSRRLTPADLALAERLGRRAGTAVENARLYTERARIAQTLQQALLPESLPQIPGAEVRARYCAAGELNEVGGDFYDVFAHGSDGWMLLIGDVCGKGPRAAGVTALARHTLRAAAMSGQSPPQMLETLHRALRLQPPGEDLCTVCLVAAQKGAGRMRLTVALAGHPPPLILQRDGTARLVGKPGTLLGVIDPVEISETVAELGPGETLLLYTDGVSEAGRADRQLGEQGLIELCRVAPGLDLDGLLDHIEHGALGLADGKLRDDIALLAFRLSPSGP